MSHLYSEQPLLFSGTLSTVAEDFKSYLEIDLDQDVSLDLLHRLYGKLVRILVLVCDTPLPQAYAAMLHAGCLSHGAEDAGTDVVPPCAVP